MTALETLSDADLKGMKKMNMAARRLAIPPSRTKAPERRMMGHGRAFSLHRVVEGRAIRR
jgi:hypothetical protein